ncbi:MAG TPA: 30S ribosomal protein S2, partial [Actinomycetota bacterium]|nr:30S ribosomal protein S2 [Actinomycetota bacterium]
FVIDTEKEHIAVKEAKKLGIPTIAVVDTNCDPSNITHVIPGNDDAIRSGSLLARVIADAVADGLGARPPEVIAAAEAAAASGVTYTAGGEEPPAEWEIQLAQEEAEKVRKAKEEPPAAAEPEPARPGAEEDETEEVRPLLDAEPIPGEDIEEELKVIYKDEEEGGRRR